jgi:predicted Zn finger-like uncharacterized protein
MIVACPSCRAKFRIADEKIAPRGAKARCSRCQTVFLVHPELGAVPQPSPEPAAPPARDFQPGSPQPRRAEPRLDLDLEAPSRASASPAPSDDPFAFSRGQGASGSDPFDARTPAHDPFAAADVPGAGPDPFGWAIPRAPAPADVDSGVASDPFQPGADPFSPDGSSAEAASAAEGGAGFDPFGARDPFAAQDPFATPPTGPEPDGAGEPWDTRPADLLAQSAAAFEESPPPAGHGLALTDLGDLLGAGPGPSVHESAPLAGPAAPRAVADLTLEDRATPPAFRSPGLDLSLGTSGAQEPPFAGPAFDLGRSAPWPELSHAQGPEPSAALALATEPTPARPARSSPRPPPLPPAPSRRPLPALDALGLDPLASPQPVPAPAQPALPEPARASPLRARRGGRLPALAVNAVALAALLAVALAILVVWRGGRLEAAAFHPAALVAALRHGPATGPFVAERVRSGLYERERGGPLLFVRGEIVSRASAPVRAVRVAVEVVREGTVVARGETLAGAVPSPEELWRAGSADALARAARRAAARVPVRFGPGEALPFLVALDEYPAELAGAALRVSAAEEEGRSR